MHIDRGVIAVINAAHHKVGFAVEHRMQGKFYAVYRSTGTFINGMSYLLPDYKKNVELLIDTIYGE